MKKEELVLLVKELFELGTKKEAEAKLADFDKLIEAVGEKLESKKKATLGKFISIEKKFVEAKPEREGRNPKTGEPITISAKESHIELKIKATNALNKAE